MRLFLSKRSLGEVRRSLAMLFGCAVGWCCWVSLVAWYRLILKPCADSAIDCSPCFVLRVVWCTVLKFVVSALGGLVVIWFGCVGFASLRCGHF